MKLPNEKKANTRTAGEPLFVALWENRKCGKIHITIYETGSKKQALTRRRDFSVPLNVDAARLLIVLGHPPERGLVLMYPASSKKSVESTIGKMARIPNPKPPAPGEKRHDAGESKAIADLAKYRSRQHDRRVRNKQPAQARAA